MIYQLKNLKRAKELGLPLTENYRVFKYSGAEVYFSGTRQGSAMTIHLAANREGKRKLREAVEEFCETLFGQYSWCNIILGIVEKKSVVNLALKCGFLIITQDNFKGSQQITIVGRRRYGLC